MDRLFLLKTQQRQLCQTVFVVFVILQAFIRVLVQRNTVSMQERSLQEVIQKKKITSLILINGFINIRFQRFVSNRKEA
ncbi:hypothetical protein ABE15_21550 [Bacillus cereus]|nr:hypothetical protein [Bacillus cereus]